MAQLAALITINEGVYSSGSSGYVITEPVTVDDARAFLRKTSTNEDAFIGSLVSAARVMCEKMTNRSAVPKTLQVEFYLDGNTNFFLLYGPVSSVLKVEYSSGDYVDYTDYTNDMSDWRLSTDNNWFIGLIGKWRITYTTAPSVSDLYVFKTAIKQAVTFMYYNRGDEQMYQLGDAREATRVVADIVKNTLSPINRMTWFG